MKAYRVAPESAPSKSALIVRAYVVVAVLGFSVSALVIWKAQEVSYETRLMTAWVVGALVAVGVVGGYWVAFSEGRRESKLSMEYLLESDSITARRPGWPDVTIPLSQITSVRENSRHGLKVVSGKSETRMIIPPEVSDFHELRAQLLGSRPALPWQETPISPLTVLLNLVVLAAYGWIWFSHDSRIVVPLLVLVFLAATNSVYWSWKTFRPAEASTRRKMAFWHLAWYAVLVLCFALIAWGKYYRH